MVAIGPAGKDTEISDGKAQVDDPKEERDANGDLPDVLIGD